MSSYYNSANVCSMNGPTDEEIKEYWKNASASFQYHNPGSPTIENGKGIESCQEDKPTEEECSVCSRMKDIGLDCWWCGN